MKGANGNEEEEEKRIEKSKRLDWVLRAEVKVEESRKRRGMYVLSSRNVKSVAEGLCQGF